MAQRDTAVAAQEKTVTMQSDTPVTVKGVKVHRLVLPRCPINKREISAHRALGYIIFHALSSWLKGLPGLVFTCRRACQLGGWGRTVHSNAAL